jgi:hypothetical protein
LKAEVNKKVGDRDITFFEIKKNFATMFMPEILPVAKAKKPTMKDIIANL